MPISTPALWKKKNVGEKEKKEKTWLFILFMSLRSLLMFHLP